MARPTGARDRLKNNFVAALHDDFQEHGKNAIVAMREKDPSSYIKCVASLMPKELEVKYDDPFEGLTDEQLAAIVAMSEGRQDSAASQGRAAEKKGAKGAAKLH